MTMPTSKTVTNKKLIFLEKNLERKSSNQQFIFTQSITRTCFFPGQGIISFLSRTVFRHILNYLSGKADQWQISKCTTMHNLKKHFHFLDKSVFPLWTPNSKDINNTFFQAWAGFYAAFSVESINRFFCRLPEENIWGKKGFFFLNPILTSSTWEIQEISWFQHNRLWAVVGLACDSYVKKVPGWKIYQNSMETLIRPTL